jgi:hypothetical protein
MQPALRQVPPKDCEPSVLTQLSMHRVFMPSWAARMAVG